jgi:hypothetical protein
MKVDWGQADCSQANTSPLKKNGSRSPSRSQRANEAFIRSIPSGPTEHILPGLYSLAFTAVSYDPAIPNAVRNHWMEQAVSVYRTQPTQEHDQLERLFQRMPVHQLYGGKHSRFARPDPSEWCE